GVSYEPVIFEGRGHHDRVAYVEQFHAPRYIPYTETRIIFQGELIVFTSHFSKKESL
ncbi:MAG: hypothetical protein HQL15_10935, partial [Candidatus Omnitrophica bacterium]|nr:hypothetical protein [Candidatus Omnitrophota bacterium]